MTAPPTDKMNGHVSGRAGAMRLVRQKSKVLFISAEGNGDNGSSIECEDK